MSASTRLQPFIEDFLTNDVKPTVRNRYIEAIAIALDWEGFRSMQNPVPADTLANRGTFVAMKMSQKTISMAQEWAVRGEYNRLGQELSDGLDEEP